MKEKKWDKEIEKLEKFIKETPMPDTVFVLNLCEKIVDAGKFFESSLETVKHNNGNPTYLPYLNRLIYFKENFKTLKQLPKVKEIKVETPAYIPAPVIPAVI